tara:strand:- start:187 stop:456 length:270 start_codon:yes stop_codon:yes gene_type:complete
MRLQKLRLILKIGTEVFAMSDQVLCFTRRELEILAHSLKYAGYAHTVMLYGSLEQQKLEKKLNLAIADLDMDEYLDTIPVVNGEVIDNK